MVKCRTLLLGGEVCGRLMDLRMQCVGYVASHCDGPSCSATCQCIEGAPIRKDFLESNNPGLLTNEMGGELVVAAVLHDSPAEFAGVLAGDRILSVNDKMRPNSCSADWSNGGETTEIVLQRGTKKMKVQLSLKPIKSFITSRQLLLTSADDSESEFRAEAPFTFGFRSKIRDGHLRVFQILSGSPADNAGLDVGDEIVSVGDGSRGQVAMTSDLSSLKDSDAPKQVMIEVFRGNLHREFTLRSRGIYEIVSLPRIPGSSPQVETAYASQ